MSDITDTYIEKATRTESKPTEKMVARLTQSKMIRLLHGAMGINTESGELMDALKKWIFYGKELDHTNILEELGDLLWYIALICDECGWSFENVMARNEAKLRKRFAQAFTEYDAINRQLDEERRVLEDPVLREAALETCGQDMIEKEEKLKLGEAAANAAEGVTTKLFDRGKEGGSFSIIREEKLEVGQLRAIDMEEAIKQVVEAWDTAHIDEPKYNELQYARFTELGGVEPLRKFL